VGSPLATCLETTETGILLNPNDTKPRFWLVCRPNPHRPENLTGIVFNLCSLPVVRAIQFQKDEKILTASFKY
jgi:hypothetical protein